MNKEQIMALLREAIAEEKATWSACDQIAQHALDCVLERATAKLNAALDVPSDANGEAK
jgi:hypothetical protein